VRQIASFFFLATLFACTFEKVHEIFGGQLALAYVLALCFLVAYLCLSRPVLPRTSAILLVFGAAFVVVYLFGFYNLNTAAGLAQFSKGLAKFVIHFTFLALAVAWLSRRGIVYYWRSLAWFFGG
jgi:predicted PurR-regulated permease PerM